MKVLHTSDWHLGQVLFNYDRREEQSFFLRQLEDCVKDVRPDALVVSGDVYNTSMPSTATQKMYTDALLAVRRACPGMTIVVTGGNHDSASKLEIDRELWNEVGVHVLGRLQYTDALQVDYAKHIIEVPGKGYIAAVPHVYPQNFPPAEDGSDRQEAFFRQLMDEVAVRNAENLPVVLMAHLTVMNTDLTGHSRYWGGIGNIEDIPLEHLGEGYDYLALGHIHREQTLSGSGGRARYCGSPVAVSFDEDYPHSFSLADVERGGKVQLTKQPVANLHPLMTLPCEAVPFGRAVEELRNSSFVGYEPYVRLNVLLSAEGLPANANEQAREAAEFSGCRFCTFRITEQDDADTSRSYIDMTPDELKEMSPVDIARQYMEGRGVPFASYADQMKEVLLRLEEEERK